MPAKHAAHLAFLLQSEWKNSEIIWVLKTGKDMKIYEIQERDPQILAELLKVWEASVWETHLFLSEEEVNKIKTYVPRR